MPTKKQQQNNEQLNEPQVHEQQQQRQEDQPPTKQMRRIHERQQLPTDKSQLIQFLSQRIKQAQQALNDTEQVLENQTMQREKVSKSIEQRNQQLQKLYDVDQKALPEKIKQKLTEILTETISQKLQAQEALHVEKQKHYEYKSRLSQLQHQSTHLNHHLSQLASKQALLNTDITNSERTIKQYEGELKQLEDEYAIVKDKKEKLEDKYLQMKVALERMNDLKAVLNRFFSNQDLFDEKMQLKPQQIKRPTIAPIIQQLPSQKLLPRIPSRDNRNNTTKLKPLNNSRKKEPLDDDDFWRGDFTANTRNKNY